MARKHEPLEVVDSSGLTDDDWAKINRLRHLHESGDSRALAPLPPEFTTSDRRRRHRLSYFAASDRRAQRTQFLAQSFHPLVQDRLRY